MVCSLKYFQGSTTVRVATTQLSVRLGASTRTRARSVLVSSTLTSTVHDTQTVHGLTSARVTLRLHKAAKFADRISTTKTSGIPT